MSAPAGTAANLRCPTVKIASPGTPGGFVVINESDKLPHHELWDDRMSEKLKVLPIAAVAAMEASQPLDGETLHRSIINHMAPRMATEAPKPSAAMNVPQDSELAADDASLRVSKGPRGKFYIKNGREHVEGPFDTEEEAMGILTRVTHC